MQTAVRTLAADLAPANDRPRHIFSETALGLYGIYELQALEDVIRGGDDLARITVAAAIRRKAGLADDGDDDGFLADYYAALCARLEGGLLLGRRRLDKLSAVTR